MERIATESRSVDLFGSGKHGFRDPAGPGIAGTRLDQAWCNGVQEELAAIIEGGGLTMDGGDLAQAAKVLLRPIAVYDMGLSALAINTEVTFAASSSPAASAGYSLAASDTEIALPSAGTYRITLHLVVTCTDTTNPLNVWAIVQTDAGSFAPRFLFRAHRPNGSATAEILLAGSCLINAASAATRFKLTLNNSAGAGTFSTPHGLVSDDHENYLTIERVRYGT